MDTPALPIYRLDALRAVEREHAADGLMERAGAATAAWATALRRSGEGRVLLIAGPGNNGGDALVAARLLRAAGIACHLTLFGERGRLPPDAAEAFRRFVDEGGEAHDDFPGDERWSLVIDGLFGVGLNRDIAGPLIDLQKTMEVAALRSGCPLLALDCPSGLDADTGNVLGRAIRASHTLSFIALKPGLLTGDGLDYCGELCVAPLDLAPLDPADDPRAVGLKNAPTLFAPALQRRRRNSHKGSHGTVGILGGAHEMVGAALLAGRAALRLGAGKTYLGLLDQDAPAVDVVQPELMIRSGQRLAATPLDALAVGPGLGQSDDARALLAEALERRLPLVADADALNLLAADEKLHDAFAERAAIPDAISIVTPHPAEAARLLGRAVADVQADRVNSARLLASRLRAWVILKGAGSIVASPEGRWWINPTGNPGLATAGTGDVLTGMLVALLAQGWGAAEASLGATWLHGEAADRLAEQHGEIGLTASELPEAARFCLNRRLAESRASPDRPV